MNHRHRFQVQLLISVGLINHYSYRIGSLWMNLETIPLPMVFGRKEKDQPPTPKISAFLGKWPFLLRADLVLSKDSKWVAEEHLWGKIDRDGSCCAVAVFLVRLGGGSLPFFQRMDMSGVWHVSLPACGARMHVWRKVYEKELESRLREGSCWVACNDNERAFRNEDFVRVRNVKEDGFIAEWNSKNPTKTIKDQPKRRCTR